MPTAGFFLARGGELVTLHFLGELTINPAFQGATAHANALSDTDHAGDLVPGDGLVNGVDPFAEAVSYFGHGHDLATVFHDWLPLLRIWPPCRCCVTACP